jgi:hypothetical protein
MFYNAPLRFVMRSVAVLLVVGTAVYAFTDDPEFGIPLIPPLFAQTEPATIPFFETSAGLSAYTQLASEDLGKIDLNALAEDLFVDVVGVGENYIIGKVVINSLAHTADIFLYADEDGWIMASAPQGVDGAESVVFYKNFSCTSPGAPHSGGRGSSTGFGSGLLAQECALGIVTTLYGASLPTDIDWYHWEFSDATHMIAGGVVASGAIKSKSMFVAVPAGSQWKDTSMRSTYRNAIGQVLLDGAPHTETLLCSTETTSLPIDLTTGESHTVTAEILPSPCSGPIVLAGTVLVYKEP